MNKDDSKTATTRNVCIGGATAAEMAEVADKLRAEYPALKVT